MLFPLLLLIMSVPVYATVFQKQPLQQQIRESDGIVVGHYLRQKGVMLEDGSIATQMIFKMNKEVGLQSELFGMDEVIVHYPGGRIKDQIVKVEGVPSFIPGESVVLMVKSKKDRYWGMNLGFGTFKVINYGNEKIIINTIFPEDRNVGQVKYEDFEKIVKRLKGSGLKVVHAPAYQIETDQIEETREPASLIQPAKIRAIASKSDKTENTESSPGFSNLWLVLILAVMGGTFRFMRTKEAK